MTDNQYNEKSNKKENNTKYHLYFIIFSTSRYSKQNRLYLKRILSSYLKFLKSSLKVEQKRIKYQVTNQARAGELTTEKVLNDNEHYVWEGYYEINKEKLEHQIPKKDI